MLERIGLAGHGVMGGALAKFFKGKGLSVYAFDPGVDVFPEEVVPVSSIGDLTETCEIVFEALPEDMPSKEEFYAGLRGVGRPVVVASLTTSLPLARFAELAGEETQVVGVHFPIPGRFEDAAEVGWLPGTDDELEGKIRELLGRLGVSYREMEYSPGYVVLRVLYRIINEACYALAEGLSSPSEIDEAMRLGVNYPEGPLAWADRIGLDTILAVLDNLEDFYRDGRFRPCPLLRKKVLNGELGVKSGRGFYDYLGGAS